MPLSDYEFVALLAYQGKEGCQNVRCTHMLGRDENGELTFGPSCLGYHCPVCHEPCSMMGHPACHEIEAVA